ncbi:MAG TPA: DNA cytosine methyltransferase [Planctomycetota bacterium]|nr:DNA cytosine methyltransferase [Planctomycetota bacterium]
MSLGFEQAGFDIAAAVEIDPIHAAVHHFNFPKTAVLARSVSTITGEDIRSLANIGKKPVDVVFGGAPCQGFSLIGHRILDDSRNQLVREFVRLVTELHAKTFVFENVKGLTIGNHKLLLHELIEAFRESGYVVESPWKVLNATDYGVPQDRQRLFLLGARKGTRVPKYPKPTATREQALFERTGITKTPTCFDALRDLPDADAFDELMTADWVYTKKWGAPSEYAQELRCAEASSWHFGYRRDWQPGILTSSMRTVHTEISRRRFAETKEGEIEPISRFFKLPKYGVCNTLRAGTDSARGAFTSPRPIHYDYARCISVREMARLHGYPDWFRFHVTKWHGARQIGNSVPPPLARAVAKSIISALGVTPYRPIHELSLGCPALLSMGMSEAAVFWRIPVPIAPRDRKNGLHKRKQEEVELSRACD